MKRLALLGLVVSLIAGCTLGLDWKNHASFRSLGKGLRLSHIDPGEIVEAKVSANLHYITIALDSVFVRNLPGLFDRSVAIGLEITGILPAGKAIQTVLDVKKGVGEHAFLAFDNVAVIEPFLYTGQNLTIALHFRAVPANEVQHMKGRLAGAGDLVKKINPARYHALETGVDLFKSIMGAFMKQELSWKYQFTLYPADSVYRDKPEMLLTAARHILLLLPPASAPSSARTLRPDKVIKFLRMRGNRLVWRHNDKEFTESPYIVLNISRYKRYPKTDTELRKTAKKIDEFIEQQNLDGARAMLPQLGAAISADKIITSQEKNLERSWKDVREARIEALEAKKNGDKQKEMSQTEKQLRMLSHIRTHFTRILYPYEMKDLDFRVSQLALRGELIAKESGLDAGNLQRLSTAYKKAVAKLSIPEKKKAPPVEDDKMSPSELAKQLPPMPSYERYYQKWWFWTLVSAGVVGATTAAVAVTTGGGQAPPPAPAFTVPFPRALRVSGGR